MAEDYNVQEGDCVSSIAFEHGSFWETLWNHSDNARLKQQRKNPNMLQAGDTLPVPDLTPPEYERPTERRHRFKLKGVPVRLRLRIMEVPRPNQTRRADREEESADDGQYGSAQGGPNRPAQKEEPRAGLPYILIVEGRLFQGRTSGDGMIEYAIPPNARDGRLILEPGTPAEFSIPLKIGCLEPVEEVAGAQARLNNLGFKCGAVDGLLGPRTKAALQSFQESHGLETSGRLDEATRGKLREAHDTQ